MSPHEETELSNKSENTPLLQQQENDSSSVKIYSGVGIAGTQIERGESVSSSFDDEYSDGIGKKRKIIVACDNWSDGTVKHMRWAGSLWNKYGVPTVLITTILIPVFIYRERYYHDFFKDNWFAAIMGFLAVTIPSSGAPVAGGVVFLPILTMYGLDAHAAVAFSAATQALGVGIFTPLSWMGRDPMILMRSFYVPMYPMALGGLLTSYLVTPLETQEAVELAFTCFIAFLFCYTLHGLLTNHLDTSETADDGASAGVPAPTISDVENGETKQPIVKKGPKRASKAERRKLKFTTSQYIIYAIVCFGGGVLTGWIGIAVEKMTFILLTYIHEVDVVAAGVSSVVMTGWLSQVAFFFHAVCAPPDDGPGPHWACALKWADNPEGYVYGNVPYKLWMAVLPGLLLGTIAGPWCNAKIGPKNVMIVFLAFLFLDIVENIYDVFFS